MLVSNEKENKKTHNESLELSFTRDLTEDYSPGDSLSYSSEELL